MRYDYVGLQPPGLSHRALNHYDEGHSALSHCRGSFKGVLWASEREEGQAIFALNIVYCNIFLSYLYCTEAFVFICSS